MTEEKPNEKTDEELNDEINAIHQANQEPTTPTEPTNAFKGFTEQEKLKKQIELIRIVAREENQHIREELETQNQTLTAIRTILEKIPVEILQAPGPAPTPGPIPQPGQQTPEQMISVLNSLGPQEKALALSSMIDGVSKLIMAWKSGGQAPQQNNDFQNMSMEITKTLLQAGVDGIMRNVYDNYNPIPIKPKWQFPGQTPPPNNDHGLQ